MSDRGVSEVIGYIIIMGIVFASIGTVYVNLFPILDDSRSYEHTKNAERVFSVLQSNIEELVENEVPKRGAEMRLKGGTLAVEGTNSSLNITVEDSGGDEIYNSTVNYNPISYETDTGRIVYENGAVMRSTSQGSAMLDEPDWELEDDGAVILPQIPTFGRAEIAGDGTVLIEATRQSSGFTNITSEGDRTVYLNVTSENRRAWESYLSSLGGIDPSDVDTPDSDTVTAEFEVDDGRTVIYSETITVVTFS